ncbi:MAG: hypothetical protein JSV80_08605 [Acidobacteriota bacterium]|nr:MAG: hypothetical protein JSV80_08605 [Acidobacteriota bacterium]
MSDLIPLIGIVLATVLITLLAVLTGVLVVSLLDVRATAKRMRQTLDRLEGPAEDTLINMREITESAAEASVKFRQLSRQLHPLVRSLGRIGPWLPTAAGLVGALAAYRASRDRASGSSRERTRRRKKVVS